MSWTDERKEQFKKLHAKNYSYGRIAIEMGGFEHCQDGGRNSCIGLAHRLGLATRPVTDGIERRNKAPRFADIETQRARKATAMRMKAKLSPVPVAPTPLAEPEIASTDYLTQFMQLENESCRYALWTGDVPFADQFFCGTPTANVLDGRPYCPFHAKICFEPRRSSPKPRPYIPGMVAAE